MSERSDRKSAHLVVAYMEASGVSRRTAQRHRKDKHPDWLAFLESGDGFKLEGEKISSVDKSEEEKKNEPEITIDLDSMPQGGDLPVDQAKRLMDAAYIHLQNAYKTGNQSKIQMWQKTWNDSSDAYRKAMVSDKELQKARGDLLPRVDMVADLLEVIGILRTMRRSLFNRVKQHLTGFSDEQLRQIEIVVSNEQAKEENIFRDLKVLKGVEDVESKLLAA